MRKLIESLDALRKESANWTVPYLHKLIKAVTSDPKGWGESSPAAAILHGMLQSVKFGNLDPYPISKLWGYLEFKGADKDEISLMKRVRSPKVRKKKVGPTFGDAYRAFTQQTGKHLILRNIDLDQDHHLAPVLLAITKAITKLPKRADLLWQSEVKSVMLVGKHSRTNDASWRPGGVMVLVLGKKGLHTVTKSVASWRYHIVHELGHALEDKLGLTVTALSSDPYGHEPYISAYADRNASEDFAETFQALEYEPRRLKRVAPLKYEDMRSRF